MATYSKDPKVLIERYNKLYTAQSPFRNEWREIAQYILPRKVIVVNPRSPGSQTTERLFSSTAIKACEDLAAAIHGTLTNNSIRWFSLKFPIPELNKDPEAAAWLEVVSDIMFAAFQQSNFASEFSELYLDIGAFGTAVLFLDEPDPTSFGLLRFKAINIAECVIAEDAWGRVDTVMRKFPLTVGAAYRRWGDALSDEVKKLYEADKIDERIEILHVVAPREEFSLEPAAPPEKRPFSDCYVEVARQHLIQEGGFYEFPYAVPRWSKNSGEDYGRGPGSVALPDVKTLNRARELKLQQWVKAINPPLGALDNSIVGSLSMVAGAINYFTDKEAVWPIESATRFDVSSINEAELVQSIRDIFFSDLISLPPMQGTPMSATEAAQRFELMERKLGPTIGRLKSELLQVTIRRAFGVLSRSGAFPVPPQSVVEAFRAIGMAQGAIDIRYEGTLEKAQRSSDLASVQQTVTLSQPMLAMDPNARVVFNAPKIIRYVAEKAGMPLDLLNSEEAIAEMQQQLAEQQAAAQQAEVAKTSAEAMRAGGAGMADMAAVMQQGEQARAQ